MTRSNALLAATLASAGLLTMAAAPPAGFSITTPAPSFSVTPDPLGKTTAPLGYAPAPLPNRDAVTPTSPRSSSDASLTPGVFTRSDQYRGQGLSPSSSVQSDQNRRVRPGGGLNLNMPLQ